MTDRQDPERKLLNDLQKWKRRARAAEALLPALAEYQGVAIVLQIGSRMQHPEDFVRYVDDVATMIRPDGRLDVRELELQLATLLQTRPELSGKGALEAYTDPTG